MPLYEFQDTETGEQFEMLLKISEKKDLQTLINCE